jgi:hypothetical protein
MKRSLFFICLSRIVFSQPDVKGLPVASYQLPAKTFKPDVVLSQSLSAKAHPEFQDGL